MWIWIVFYAGLVSGALGALAGAWLAGRFR